jgi:hypothetical protein
LRRGIHYTLLLVHPYESGVVYLDSGSANHKDYTDIKGVLDKAFNGFVAKADRPLKKQKKVQGCFTLFHQPEFCCHKQAEPDSGLEANRTRPLGARKTLKS